MINTMKKIYVIKLFGRAIAILNMVVTIGLIEISFKQLSKDVKKIAKWVSVLRSLKTEGVTTEKALRQENYKEQCRAPLLITKILTFTKSVTGNMRNKQ